MSDGKRETLEREFEALMRIDVFAWTDEQTARAGELAHLLDSAPSVPAGAKDEGDGR